MGGLYVIGNIPVQSTPAGTSFYSHFDIIGLLTDVTVKLLKDNAEAFVPLEIKRGKPGKPFAMRTWFGWWTIPCAKDESPCGFEFCVLYAYRLKKCPKLSYGKLKMGACMTTRHSWLKTKLWWIPRDESLGSRGQKGEWAFWAPNSMERSIIDTHCTLCFDKTCMVFVREV